MLPLSNISALRTTANGFMTEPISIIEITNYYDIYGQQTTSGMITWSGLGYVGNVSGKDREMLNQLNQYWGGRDGNATTYTSLVLLPFETPIQVTNVIRFSGQDWDIIWHNNDTQDTVQLYTKIIVSKKTYADKRDT
jgi:hypothetical protein